MQIHIPNHFMRNQTLRIIVSIGVIPLLQTGCATHESGQAGANHAIVSRELAKSRQSWDGNLLPAYPKGQPEVTIRRITIPAGARLELHRHPVINAGMLLDGQLTVVTAGGKKLHLKAGDPIIELVNTMHYGINQGKVPAEIIIVYAGSVGTPTTLIQP